ncbi:MAG: SRPBCC family protein [Xanthomonadaceae bacterium]|nr:SRPBCC family protein [Xanthomonadaceae bacterium]
MKSIHAAAAIALVSIIAAGCKPAPAPEAAAPAEAAPAPAAVVAEVPVLTVSKSVSITATADAVWAKAKDFNNLNGWHPAVAKTEIVEGSNNTVGAVRLLTLAGDTPATVKEKLTAFDDAGKSYSYEIIEGVLPVTAYSSTITVAADGADKATVTWSSTFKRADASATPAAGKDDATATTTIEGVYTAGLDNLKKVLEAK